MAQTACNFACQQPCKQALHLLSPKHEKQANCSRPHMHIALSAAGLNQQSTLPSPLDADLGVGVSLSAVARSLSLPMLLPKRLDERPMEKSLSEDCTLLKLLARLERADLKESPPAQHSTIITAGLCQCMQRCRLPSGAQVRQSRAAKGSHRPHPC